MNLHQAHESWRRLRVLRADPPSSAGRGARRNMFGAALEQGEQLWKSARDLPPQTSPIALFYGLSQAARALLAAYGSKTGWNARPSHGLALLDPEVSTTAIPMLTDLRLRDSGSGLFQQIADLVHSPTLPAEATMSALICSLPESDEFLLTDEGDPRPLLVRQDEGFDLLTTDSMNVVRAWISPLPGRLIPDSPVVNPSDPEHLPAIGEIHDWLQPYPSLCGEHPPGRVSKLIKASPLFAPENQIRIEWELESVATHRDQREWIKGIITYPTHGVFSTRSLEGHAIPSVSGNSLAMHPLVTWWGILCGMSMLARYYPTLWTKLLDVDHSNNAEGIRQVLDAAYEGVPYLLLLEFLILGGAAGIADRV